MTTQEGRCCVCERPVEAEKARRIGARTFCVEHHQRALHASRAHWTRSGLVETGLVALFVAGVGGLRGSGASGALPTSLGMGIALALVPALIWLVYVYRQDRLEPEPIGLVLGVFVMGGLLGGAVAAPLAEHVFGVREWQGRSTVAGIVAAIAVMATLQQLCTYLAVRYTAYVTAEFDEPIDGVIYATAAGIGLATVLNVEFVVDNDGVLPLAGATFIATTTLVHVAAAVVLGYGMGRARFSSNGQAWLSACFAGSVLLSGGLGQLALMAGTRGATFRPWLALAVSAGIAAAVLLAFHVLVARMSRRTLGGVSHGAA
jgi:RsiW-degrading membrane proteinase PrsW (M82 family)